MGRKEISDGVVVVVVFLLLLWRVLVVHRSGGRDRGKSDRARASGASVLFKLFLAPSRHPLEVVGLFVTLIVVIVDS
jgi:hypothetical protein